MSVASRKKVVSFVLSAAKLLQLEQRVEARRSKGVAHYVTSDASPGCSLTFPCANLVSGRWTLPIPYQLHPCSCLISLPFELGGGKEEGVVRRGGNGQAKRSCCLVLIVCSFYKASCHSSRIGLRSWAHDAIRRALFSPPSHPPSSHPRNDLSLTFYGILALHRILKQRARGSL